MGRPISINSMINDSLFTKTIKEPKYAEALSALGYNFIRVPQTFYWGLDLGEGRSIWIEYCPKHKVRIHTPVSYRYSYDKCKNVDWVNMYKVYKEGKRTYETQQRDKDLFDRRLRPKNTWDLEEGHNPFRSETIRKYGMLKRIINHDEWNIQYEQECINRFDEQIKVALEGKSKAQESMNCYKDKRKADMDNLKEFKKLHNLKAKEDNND